jgi:putative transposase
MAGALAYRPDRTKAVFVFQIKNGAYNTDSLIQYLTDLRGHLQGQPVTLIWDGLPSHRSKAMKTFIASQRHWLRVEQLPGYAHELNPMELVWGNVKARELANLCPRTLLKPTPQPKPACAESDAATTCASTSLTIQALPSDPTHPNTEGSLTVE